MGFSSQFCPSGSSISVLPVCLYAAGRDGPPRTHAALSLGPSPGSEESRGSARRNTLLKRKLSFPIKAPARFPAFMGFPQRIYEEITSFLAPGSQTAVGSARAELRLIPRHRRCRAEGREPPCLGLRRRTEDAHEKPFAPSGVPPTGSNLLRERRHPLQHGRAAAFGRRAPRAKETSLPLPESTRSSSRRLLQGF